MKWPAHGANPQYLFDALQIPLPDQRIDFSANINPLGPPGILKENWNQLYDVVSDYPDPKGNQLKQKLAKKEEIHSSQILVGNGGAEIISLIGRMLAGKRVVIVQHGYGDFCWIDFEEEEALNELPSQAIAELLYLGHLKEHLKLPFYK